jgi:NO-binding membrane sensor protein with MHYT domain
MLLLNTCLCDAVTLLPLACSWCVCLVSALAAVELLGERRYGTARLRVAAAGLVMGAGVWAQPFLAGGWPADIGFALRPTLVSLSFAMATMAWGFAIGLRHRDARGLMGGGATLGGGIAISHGALLFAIRGHAEINFDDVPIFTAMALASACGVAFVLTRRRWRGAGGRIAQGALLAAAVAIAHAVESAAIVVEPLGGRAPDATTVVAAAMTPIAGLVLISVMLGLCVLARRVRVSPATRRPAWRKSSRPSPSSIPAGTTSLHPAPARSTASRAAAPERQGPQGC